MLVEEALDARRGHASTSVRARDEWDRSVSRLATPPIVQSWGWGQAEISLGHRVARIELPGGGLVTVVITGAGPLRHAVAHGGPVPATLDAVDDLTTWARRTGLARLRISPDMPLPRHELEARGFVHQPAEDSGCTLIVTPGPDDQMLASFTKRARRGIRTATAAGVKVDCGNEPEVLGELAAITGARHRLYLPGAGVYRALLANLHWARTYVARFEGKPLAAALVGHFGRRAVYLFGGSSGEHRHLDAPYLVQWAAMKDAYADGCLEYDFWGIPPTGDPAHPMHGLWLFKTTFGGRIVERGGVWDVVLSRWREAASQRERALRVTVREMRDRLRGRNK